MLAYLLNQQPKFHRYHSKYTKDQKSIQKFKDFCEWLPPKRKVVDEALELFKNQITKFYNKRDTSCQLKESKSALKNIAIQYRIEGKDLIDPDLFLLNSKQPITTL